MGLITGTSGQDILVGTPQPNLLFALAGNDRAFGQAGNDTLYGGKGDDTLYGGKGNDSLYGDLGNDVLFGDRGADMLTGGAGRDLFVLGRSSTTGTSDTTGGPTQADADRIVDFTDGEDLIGLAGGLTFGDLNIVQSGANTVIQDQVSGEFLAVLQGVQRSLISAADFTTNLMAIATPTPTPTPPTPTPPIVPPTRPPIGPTPTPTPPTPTPTPPTPTPTPPTPTPTPPTPTPTPEIDAYALTSNNQLLGFDTEAPGSILSTVTVTGLQTDERLLGIDFRPAGGQLFGLGSTNQIYTLDSMTGAATAVGMALTPALMGIAQGFDFNPVPDRIRVVNDSNQNLRLNPDTAAALEDGTLAFAVGDPNEGVDPAIVGAAYTNSMMGATTTMLYGIDYLRDILVLQNPPNDGILNTIGTGLSIDVDELVSFDIRTVGMANEAFAAIAPDFLDPVSNLYSINLQTGTATLIGPIGNGVLVTGLALPTV